MKKFTLTSIVAILSFIFAGNSVWAQSEPYHLGPCYGEIARAVSRPGAGQAVGSAIGANPVSLLIPCHRVIRSSGEPGNYHWGKERKRAILEWEAAQTKYNQE